MKKTTNYPVYLFEKPLLIPKTKEETKELLFKIDEFLTEYETSRREKTKAFNLCVEYFQANLKLELNATFQFSILGQDNILVEFILEDKESEFIKQLRKYNQVLRDKGRAEFQYLFMKIMRNRENLSVEDEVIQMFYSGLSKIPNFKEEITEDDKFKITYQIGNQI
jgi:hypothetical protein